MMNTSRIPRYDISKLIKVQEELSSDNQSHVARLLEHPTIHEIVKGIYRKIDSHVLHQLKLRETMSTSVPQCSLAPQNNRGQDRKQCSRMFAAEEFIPALIVTVPRFIFGKPLFEYESGISVIIDHLRNDGFFIERTTETNILISWHKNLLYVQPKSNHNNLEDIQHPYTFLPESLDQPPTGYYLTSKDIERVAGTPNIQEIQKSKKATFVGGSDKNNMNRNSAARQRSIVNYQPTGKLFMKSER